MLVRAASKILRNCGHFKKITTPIHHAHKRILFIPDAFAYSQYSVSSSSQSVLLPGPDRIRASGLTDDPTKIVGDVPNATVNTVFDVLYCGLKHSNDGDCAGYRCEKTRKFHWIKYSEVIEKSQDVGSALVNAGLNPCNDSLVGIFSTNCVEFLQTLCGCAGYSMVMVPLYDTLGMEAVHCIITQACLKLVICKSNNHALMVLKHISKLPSVKTVIIIDTPSPEVLSAAKETGLRFQTFQEFEMEGKQNRKKLVLPKLDDLFCIPYTSGTTGNPKGVVLTHRNIISCISGLVYGYEAAGTFGGTIISYLPPAHIYEIMNEIASLYFGRRIGFFKGEIRDLLPFICDLKPTIIPLVPKLMNLVYNKAIHDLKSHKIKWFFTKFALSQKEKLLKKGIISKSTIWDKYLFKEFRDSVGGNTHVITTTSAPVSSEVMKFYRCASGCYLFEAYGQTEVLASNMTIYCEHDGGFVGPPLPCNHIKLVDIPEMNYFSKDDVGEVCFKGVNVFQGYFKNPVATAESIDKDGWHHSGDIGRWLPNGALQIIDRKKHLFKLSQGEYIAPEKVECIYANCKLIFQVYIDGHTTEDYTVALAYPDPIQFPKWIKEKGFSGKPQSGILKDKDVRREFLKELHMVGKERDLNSFEQAKNICLLSEAFSLENNLLTPTMKIKRNDARKKFDLELQEMYKEGPIM